MAQKRLADMLREEAGKNPQSKSDPADVEASTEQTAENNNDESNQIAQLQEAIADLKQELEQERELTKKLRSDLDSAWKTKVDLEDKLDKKNQEAEQLQQKTQESDRWKSKFEEAKQAAVHLTEENDQLNQQIQDLQQELESTQEKNNELNQQLEQLQSKSLQRPRRPGQPFPRKSGSDRGSQYAALAPKNQNNQNSGDLTDWMD
ncbi:hypothetical protein [Geitlerinema sp. PCC 9228]|jgi:chromosome segregation ATPase|uniref:hypothetical protein n=1 Tax=Geitlerinema sp. PCC 9228 TaxID=111611 RepID=UPI0008F9CB9F|nr:hypothetical protein [Geitlerinema sp. PCC 9228]